MERRQGCAEGLQGRTFVKDFAHLLLGKTPLRAGKPLVQPERHRSWHQRAPIPAQRAASPLRGWVTLGAPGHLLSLKSLIRKKHIEKVQCYGEWRVPSAPLASGGGGTHQEPTWCRMLSPQRP